MKLKVLLIGRSNLEPRERTALSAVYPDAELVLFRTDPKHALDHEVECDLIQPDLVFLRPGSDIHLRALEKFRHVYCTKNGLEEPGPDRTTFRVFVP